jgi:hypothetical protein
MRRVCVFCGSSVGQRPLYREAAARLGRLLAERGIEVVFGGGHVGLMGVLADAALAVGGRVIGVIPQALEERELAHRSLSELHVVESMHARKALMADLADGFIALPGGYGTFEELLEVVTWAQLRIHDKPSGLLNVGGFYDPLLAQIERAVVEGFVRQTHQSLLLAATDPEQLLAAMEAYEPVRDAKWLGPQER